MDHDKYIGRLLDNRYEILEVIGTGGMAMVYKARCHRLNRLVAIKILKDDLSHDEEFRRRFHAESQAVAMLSHPNIMSVYDVSNTDDADYIVMELIDGIPLKQYMEKKGVLNWKETLHFAMQIGKALEHAHSRGIVHRDIKPHNVMVLKNGSVKVTDFGIARIKSKSNTLTREALGSVHYISPEQAKGGRVDNRSDIYSLGVVMYEMMTGRPPYDGESPVAVAIQHINGGAQMPSVLNPNIPGGLEQIIMKAMALDPANRYNNATALLYDLEEFRKNPSMLFYFSGGSIDELAQIQNVTPVKPEPAVPAVPKTTAERMVQARADRPAVQNRTRTSAGEVKRTPQRQASPQRQNQSRTRQEREEELEDRSRVITTAVLICSAIAVISIVIFLIVLFNGGVFGSNTTMVPVPNLVGKMYAELDVSKYPDLNISVGDYIYSDEFEYGQIVEQKPDANAQVPPDSNVKVWISMGPEEDELPPMQDLSTMTEEAAINYLKALDETLIPMVRQENHDEIKEGLVVRTEPAAGDPLTRGQTVVIYLSMGPAVKTASVPNVIGMSATNAINTLRASGFDNYKLEKEESQQEKDEVIRLSVEVNEELDVTTEIIIYISEGVVREKMPGLTGCTEAEAEKKLNDLGFYNLDFVYEENEVEAGIVFRQSITEGVEIDTETLIVLYVSEGMPETTVPPTDPPKVTRSVSISLPTDKEEAYTLTVMLDGVTIVDGMTIQPGTATISVEMTGTGVGYYEVYIDGVYYKTEKVDFSA